MKDYRIGYNMYKMIREEKDSDGSWKKFMTYVIDKNVKVIVALHGKDHMKIIYDPNAPDQIQELPV